LLTPFSLTTDVIVLLGLLLLLPRKGERKEGVATVGWGDSTGNLTGSAFRIVATIAQFGPVPEN